MESHVSRSTTVRSGRSSCKGLNASVQHRMARAGALTVGSTSVNGGGCTPLPELQTVGPGAAAG